MPLLSEMTTGLKGLPLVGSFLRGISVGGAGGDVVAIPVSITPHTNRQVNSISFWGLFSDSHNVVVGGDGAGDDLIIVDFTDKDNPALISEPFLDNNKGGAYKAPNDMWAFSESGGIYHLDLATLPTVTLTQAFVDIQILGAEYDPVNDRILAVKNTTDIFYEFDVSNPKALTVAASLGGFTSSSSDWKKKSYAPETGYFWVENGTSLTGVDVSEPGNPKGIVSAALGHGTSFFRAYKNYLLVVNSSVSPSVIEVYDMTTPTAPSNVATISVVAKYLKAFTIRDGALYVASNSGDVYWFDITDLSNPVQVGGPVDTLVSDPTSLEINDVGDTLYVITWAGSQALAITFE